MKKLLVLAMGLIIACGACFAQPKTTDKALWKQAKKKAKELTKEGWKTSGVKPLEVYFYDFYKKLEDSNNKEVPASVEGQTNIKTTNQAEKWAMWNRSTSYATQAKSMIVGRITGETSGGTTEEGSLDNFYAAYEAAVAKEMEGEFKTPSIVLYKEKKDGTLDYRMYYILNEDAASQARIRAMENAMIESEFARANAERISEFVRERVDFISE